VTFNPNLLGRYC